MEALGDNNLININIQHDILYEQYIVQESTCKTDIEAAVEAAKGFLSTWTVVPVMVIIFRVTILCCPCHGNNI